LNCTSYFKGPVFDCWPKGQQSCGFSDCPSRFWKSILNLQIGLLV
jgi:hypothetical protein